MLNLIKKPWTVSTPVGLLVKFPRNRFVGLPKFKSNSYFVCGLKNLWSETFDLINQLIVSIDCQACN